MTLYELEHSNYDPSHLKVNDWQDYASAGAPKTDFIVALSDRPPRSAKPDWPAEPLIITWRIADPLTENGDELQRRRAFVKALSKLESRISIFVNLPIESLDRLKLQQRLNEIGQ